MYVLGVETDSGCASLTPRRRVRHDVGRVALARPPFNRAGVRAKVHVVADQRLRSDHELVRLELVVGKGGAGLR